MQFRCFTVSRRYRPSFQPACPLLHRVPSANRKLISCCKMEQVATRDSRAWTHRIESCAKACYRLKLLERFLPLKTICTIFLSGRSRRKERRTKAFSLAKKFRMFERFPCESLVRSWRRNHVFESVINIFRVIRRLRLRLLEIELD